MTDTAAGNAKNTETFVLRWPSASRIEERLRAKAAEGIAALDEELRGVVRTMGLLEDTRVLLAKTTKRLVPTDPHHPGFVALAAYVDHAFRRSLDYAYALQCLSEGLARVSTNDDSIDAVAERAKRSYGEDECQCVLSAVTQDEYIRLMCVALAGGGDSELDSFSKHCASVHKPIVAWLRLYRDGPSWDEVDLRPSLEYLKGACAVYMSLPECIKQISQKTSQRFAERAVKDILDRSEAEKESDRKRTETGEPETLSLSWSSRHDIEMYVRSVASMSKADLDREIDHTHSAYRYLEEAKTLANTLLHRHSDEFRVAQLTLLERFLHATYFRALDIANALCEISNRLKESLEVDAETIEKAVARATHDYDEVRYRCTLTTPSESYLVSTVEACDAVPLDRMPIARMNHGGIVQMDRKFADLLKKAPKWFDVDLESAAEHADALANLDLLIQAALKLSHEKRDPEGARKVSFF